MSTLNLNASISVKDFNGKCKEKMWVVSLIESNDLIEVATEDGLTLEHAYLIKVENFFTGFGYILNHEFTRRIYDHGGVSGKRRAQMFKAKIEREGRINLENWSPIE